MKGEENRKKNEGRIYQKKLAKFSVICYLQTKDIFIPFKDRLSSHCLIYPFGLPSSTWSTLLSVSLLVVTFYLMFKICYDDTHTGGKCNPQKTMRRKVRCRFRRN